MRQLLVFILLGAQAAFGADPKATALAKEAEQFYKENKYREAAELLKKANELEPVPVYVYNIARAFDQAGDLDVALEYYRRYVALPSNTTQPDLVKKANLAMDRLRTLVAKAEAEKRIREAEKRRLEEETRNAEARATAEAAAARRQRQEFEAKEKARLQAETEKFNSRKLLSITTGGVTVAALGSSLGFALAAGANRDAFRKAVTLERKQKLEAEARTTAAIADISLLVGVAAAVTTVVLFPKGIEQQKSVNVVLAPVDSGLVAAVGGQF